ncbi:hypothetical protein Clacol_006913 [Clathrus columnatus]|uniref:Uncharacterized protein n=1 Tax=Clathrus columnatus TaxID=1419009 RepID=A0AAV5AJ14_9AGAM|nr:hypothetical protein Clacol_006913 [Clathrus columnatus]
MTSSDNSNHDIVLPSALSSAPNANTNASTNFDSTVTSFMFSAPFQLRQSSSTTQSNTDHLSSYSMSDFAASGNAHNQPLFSVPSSSVPTTASISQQIFPTSFPSVSASTTAFNQNNNHSFSLPGVEAQVPKTVVIDNLLEKVIRTTQDARDAFAQSRSQDGKQRLAELKAVVDLVVSFVSPLSSKPSPPALKPLTSFGDSHSHFQPPWQRVSPPGVKKSSTSSSRKSSMSGSVPQLIPSPPEDASRKRCGSPQGDRVVKSLKLESKEEPSLLTSLANSFLNGAAASNSIVVPSVSVPTSLSTTPSSTSVATASGISHTTIPPQLVHSKTYPPASLHPHSHVHGLGTRPRLSSRPSMESLPSISRTDVLSNNGVGSNTVGVSVQNAAMAHQLNLMQQQQQHHQLSLGHTHSLSTSHIPTVHSPLVPSLLSNGSQSALTNDPEPSGTVSQSGWPDSIALQNSLLSATAGSSSTLQHTQTHFHPTLPSLPLTAPGRPTRSASHSGAFSFPSFDLTSSGNTTSNSTHTTEDMSTVVVNSTTAVDAPPPPPSVANSSSPDYGSDGEDSPGRLHTGTVIGSSTTSRTTDYVTTHTNNEISPELKAEVDRIFFEFMNIVCSDLNAKDSKGEPIHQPLMAKKMERLNESPDYRPFKFRIQAFTNGFLEEVRHYLWTNPYISRFNEDGKKAKSKGNHIWNIDAKKVHEGGWHFRPFRRKIAGTFPNVAYVGIKWQFRPRVWDPQASRSNLQVRFSSPNLPSWLSWNGDIISGTPGPDAQGSEFTIEAHFSQEGNDVVLSQKYFLSVAPLTRDSSTSFTMGPRRPSIANEQRHIPDAVLTQSGHGTLLSSSRSSSSPTGANSAAALQDALTVVTEAIKAVSLEAHAVQTGSPAEQLQMQNSLTRQEHVLTSTAQAMNRVMIASTSQDRGDTKQTPIVEARSLAFAGTEVVICAVQKVAADRSAVIQMTTGMTASELDPPIVTMEEVSTTTKSAVAEAVEITDTTASPIDVMLTAETIIQQNTQPLSVPVTVPSMLNAGPAPSYPLTAHGVPSFQNVDMPSFDYPMGDISPS